MTYLSDDSDMTDPFAPIPETLPLDEAVRVCPAFWGPVRLKEYYATQNAIRDRRRRISKQRRKIRKELGPIIKTCGLLRESGRIRKSLRLECKYPICRRENRPRKVSRGLKKGSTKQYAGIYGSDFEIEVEETTRKNQSRPSNTRTVIISLDITAMSSFIYHEQDQVPMPPPFTWTSEPGPTDGILPIESENSPSTSELVLINNIPPTNIKTLLSTTDLAPTNENNTPARSEKTLRRRTNQYVKEAALRAARLEAKQRGEPIPPRRKSQNKKPKDGLNRQQRREILRAEGKLWTLKTYADPKQAQRVEMREAKRLAETPEEREERDRRRKLRNQKESRVKARLRRKERRAAQRAEVKALTDEQIPRLMGQLVLS